MDNRVPIVSFTFDDFPRSALRVGGKILRAHGFTGTYYAALGLIDHDSPVGRIFSAGDIQSLLADGHELGCHTFGHDNAWQTDPDTFESSIEDNRRALAQLLPGTSFRTFAYPINVPRPRTKLRAGRRFACCRGGGNQTFNRGILDLNNVEAFFLEMSRDRPEAVRDVIVQNAAACGWLVFATHDIDDHPSRFGVTPGFFEKVVHWAVESQARILPVVRALEEGTLSLTGDRLLPPSRFPHV